MGYSSQGCKESNVTECVCARARTHTHTYLGTLNVLKAKETENKILSLPPRSFLSNGRDKT